jgi:FecR protein
MKSELPVEPLSESRWAKLEGAMFAELERAPHAEPTPTHMKPLRAPLRNSPALWAGSAATLALAAGALFTVLKGDGAEHFAHAPSRIVTGLEHSHLTWGQSEIEILDQSTVVASGDDTHGVLLVVEKGGVDCEVAPRAGRPPFVVQAGDTRVRVVGTKFRVARAATGGTEVAVDHGTVEVSRNGKTTMVHAGEHWPMPEATSVPTPVEKTPIAQEPTVATESREAPAHVKHLGDQTVYENAAKHEHSDPNAAMTAYRALASGGGPWAANALYSAGRLALERGQAAEGTRLLKSYLKRFPKGPNALDAERLLQGGH